MNLEQAKYNMLEQQIRPCGGVEPKILAIISKIPREEFVAPYLRNLAFADLELPLACGQNMLPPKIEARFIQALNIKKTDTVLEIGTGSGYMTAILAYLAASVTSLEIFSQLAKLASDNLLKCETKNATVLHADAASYWNRIDKHEAPQNTYDVICFSGSIPHPKQATLNNILQYLNIGGRCIICIGSEPIMTVTLITRYAKKHYIYLNLFETYIKPLLNAPHINQFIF